MTLRDKVRSSSPSVAQKPGPDVSAERPAAEPTVLSTVWEGRSSPEPAGDTGEYPRALDLEPSRDRLRLLRWLLAPTTRGRALVITTMAALICGGALALSGLDDVTSPRGSSDTDRVGQESAAGDLTSRAVRAEGSDAVAEAEPVIRQATSADARLRLTAQQLQTEAGSWMLEAESLDPSASMPAVSFTVNGVVAEQVDRAPYQVLLTSELLSTLPGVGDGRPLIVTASAFWPDGDSIASPATVVLSD